MANYCLEILNAEEAKAGRPHMMEVFASFSHLFESRIPCVIALVRFFMIVSGKWFLQTIPCHEYYSFLVPPRHSGYLTECMLPLAHVPRTGYLWMI